jgi:hypothetical protein
MTDYLNNSNKNDINRVNKQYYAFLRNIYNGKNFEQQQDINNFFNSTKNNNENNNNKNNNNKNDDEKTILLQTKKELEELNKERCLVMKTDHSEDFKNIDNGSLIKKIFYIFILILVLYYFSKNV